MKTNSTTYYIAAGVLGVLAGAADRSQHAADELQRSRTSPWQHWQLLLLLLLLLTPCPTHDYFNPRQG